MTHTPLLSTLRANLNRTGFQLAHRTGFFWRLQPLFERSPWWSWLVLAGALLAAFVVGKKVRALLLKQADRLGEKGNPVAGSIVRGIATATAILMGTLIVVLGGAFIRLSPILADLHWDLIKVLLLISGIWILFGLTDLAAHSVQRQMIGEHNEYGEMTINVVKRIVRAFFGLLLFVFVLENMLGFNVAALIAGMGIIGLALSLAGKESAQNLFGAISIFINRPFVVGDWVVYKGDLGEVEEVELHSTNIRLLSGEVLVVPNMHFISEEIVNLSLRQYLRCEMNISIPFDTPEEKVGEAMDVLNQVLRSEDIVREGKCDLEKKPPVISFSDYGDYYLNIKIYYWYFIGDSGGELDRNSERGWFSYLHHRSLVNRAVMRAFNEHCIEFAFPTQTLHVEAEECGEDGKSQAGRHRGHRAELPSS